MSRYAATGGFPFPTRYDSSAFNLCMCILSCSEYIATDLIPNSLHALNTRIAISPKLQKKKKPNKNNLLL